MMSQTSEHLEPGLADVETGERFAVSPMTGNVYRVTKWIAGESAEQIRAVEKEQLSKTEVKNLPADVREWVDYRRKG